MLQFATRGACIATPHRVVNRSISRSRVSIPVFLNPGLAATVAPLGLPEAPPRAAPDGAHVHHVLDLAAPREAFVFGHAEWRRKGENRWCRLCADTPAPPATDG